MKDLEKTDVQNFKAWIHVVTRNQCLMKLRKQSKTVSREQDIETIEHSLASDSDQEEKKLKEQQLTQLEEAILELKPEQKQCVELFYIQQKCYQDVAEITGFTLKQVKSFIQNGKRNLKIILTKNEVTVQ
jgi:RNA polymerase sigma factor (sigma-70 family)